MVRLKVQEDNVKLKMNTPDGVTFRTNEYTPIMSGSSDYNELDNKPSINGHTLEGDMDSEGLDLFSGDYDDLTNKPDLFSGDYNDLDNKPSINGNTLEGDMTTEDLGITGGMNITVDGTDYPITSITKTLVSGVSGVLVNYDDGNNGQLFFADGVGLNTVKTVIEGTIPHDTSDLTNGGGFLTISDLPIYNGGVE